MSHNPNKGNNYLQPQNAEKDEKTTPELRRSKHQKNQILKGKSTKPLMAQLKKP
jgi:hypothetical protein